MKESLFFDNQKQAASVLGIHVENLQEYKANGCPAFRSGRIYRAELAEWMKEKGKAGGRPARHPDLAEMYEATSATPINAIAWALQCLEKCRHLKVLCDKLYFETATALVEAADYPEMREEWIRQLFQFIAREFGPDLEGCFEKFPEMMKWVFAQKDSPHHPDNWPDEPSDQVGDEAADREAASKDARLEKLLAAPARNGAKKAPRRKG